MHSTEVTHYRITGDTYIFAHDADSEAPETWYSMDTNIPFERTGHGKYADVQWALDARLRPSANSPLFGVHHSLNVAITCSYEVPERTEKATEKLQFSLPIQFVQLSPLSPPPRPTTTPLPCSATSNPLASSALSPSMIPSVSYAQSLPAYSQLFDENGDRKIDYSIPLPLYEPQSSASASSLVLSSGLLTSERKEALEETLQLLTDFSLVTV
jgi:hypothetical protein